MSYEETKQELDRRMKLSTKWGNINKRFAYGFVAIGLCASAITTISVATTALTPSMNAMLSALPGIVVMSFRFLSSNSDRCGGSRSIMV
jgi:hypothetical protein